jgi:cytochrome d ubiquinol oxidase subunit I
VLSAIVAAAAEPAQLLPARTQMAFTLGVHIVLVPFGVAFTAMALIANYRGLRHGDAVALRLAERWSRVAAVLFAVGAVTGTVLSFEMGLLWPGLMHRFGQAYGIPFVVEGLFFFIEAIFVAIYIYGWKRMRPWPHFWAGVPVVLSGIGGALSVVAANAWMNDPGGYTLRKGRVVAVDPAKVIFNGAFWHESLHMLLAAYIVAGFLVGGVYATGMLRGRRDRYHRLGFLIPFTVAAVAMPFQIAVGDAAARWVFSKQPVKFAAMELVPKTSRNVPESIGGYASNGRVHGPKLTIPGVASFLSGWSTNTTVKGFESVAPADRPPITIVHLAWDVMVGLGTALLGLAVWFAVLWRRRRDLTRATWFLRAASIAGVAALVTMWAGWSVTEVGRQPYIVYGVLRTRDAVTRADGVWWSLAGVFVLYALLTAATFLVLRSMARRWRRVDEEGVSDSDVPYGPARVLDAGPGRQPAALGARDE